jgi:hypothetical protein
MKARAMPKVLFFRDEDFDEDFEDFFFLSSKSSSLLDFFFFEPFCQRGQSAM